MRQSPAALALSFRAFRRRFASAQPVQGSCVQTQSVPELAALCRNPLNGCFEGQTESSAASLLTQAHEARSRGQIESGNLSFGSTAARFKGSSEARVSRVSLGKLYMNKNLAGAALQQFSDYLVAGGPLEEEALVGRAQALAALGRRSEELSTWQMLINAVSKLRYTRSKRGTPKLLDQRLGKLAPTALSCGCGP